MLALIISLANLPVRGEKKAADSDRLHFMFHAEKRAGGRKAPAPVTGHRRDEIHRLRISNMRC